jgi:hypothetical protein
VRAARLAVLAAAVLVLPGCREGVSAYDTAFEPVQVSGGEFFPGPLPTGTGPKVQTILVPSTEFNAGFGSWNIGGDADLGAYSVAMRFVDMGTGYWSVPVGAADVMVSGAVTWGASLAFSLAIPPGKHNLEFSAIDVNGTAGPANLLTVNLTSPVPKGKVVISLSWDSAADLDLHLVAPDGTELWSGHPNTYMGDDGMLPMGTAVLDRDSNGSCVQDNLREEDAVFADPPLPGAYLVRVDMVSACGAAWADFVLEVRQDGNVTQTIDGRLLARDADGGGPGTGLYVATLNF